MSNKLGTMKKGTAAGETGSTKKTQAHMSDQLGTKTKRKYKLGHKKLKNVKMYEDFEVIEDDDVVVAENTTKE